MKRRINYDGSTRSKGSWFCFYVEGRFKGESFCIYNSQLNIKSYFIVPILTSSVKRVTDNRDKILRVLFVFESEI